MKKKTLAESCQELDEAFQKLFDGIFRVLKLDKFNDWLSKFKIFK